MKSRSVKLTLLSAIALAYMGCDDEPEQPETPYDQYNYYGHANEPGMAYSHYHNGMFEWFLLSRMFNGYGYYPPTYRPFYYRRDDRDRNGNGGGVVSRPYGMRYFNRSAPSTEGLSSGHSVPRGGFGSYGYGRGGHS